MEQGQQYHSKENFNKRRDNSFMLDRKTVGKQSGKSEERNMLCQSSDETGRDFQLSSGSISKYFTEKLMNKRKARNMKKTT